MGSDACELCQGSRLVATLERFGLDPAPFRIVQVKHAV